MLEVGCLAKMHLSSGRLSELCMLDAAMMCLPPVWCAGGENKFAPVERELVFDIDLTDYDDVRTCGQGGHICRRCWPLMALAVRVGLVMLSAASDRQGARVAIACS